MRAVLRRDRQVLLRRWTDDAVLEQRHDALALVVRSRAATTAARSLDVRQQSDGNLLEREHDEPAADQQRQLANPLRRGGHGRDRHEDEDAAVDGQFITLINILFAPGSATDGDSCP